jgi:Luciferase-like monooxygenase
VRALWTQSPATYHGKHYHIENAYCSPQPNPIPPILVGTNGKKALAVAARLADAWNWDFSISAFESAYRVLKQQWDAIGRDVREIRLTLGGTAHFPKDPSEFVPADTTAVDIAVEGSIVPVEPKLGPTPSDAIEQLRPLIERGVCHFKSHSRISARSINFVRRWLRRLHICRKHQLSAQHSILRTEAFVLSWKMIARRYSMVHRTAGTLCVKRAALGAFFL